MVVIHTVIYRECEIVLLLSAPQAGPMGSLAIMQVGPEDLEAYFRYKNTSYTKDTETGEIKVRQSSSMSVVPE